MDEIKDEIKFIESFGVLNLQPGDILVIKVSYPLNEKTHKYLIEMAKKAFGERKIVILEAGMDIGVLREKAE